LEADVRDALKVVAVVVIAVGLAFGAYWLFMSFGPDGSSVAGVAY
jgi:hypothetical protein